MREKHYTAIQNVYNKYLIKFCVCMKYFLGAYAQLLTKKQNFFVS